MTERRRTVALVVAALAAVVLWWLQTDDPSRPAGSTTTPQTSSSSPDPSGTPTPSSTSATPGDRVDPVSGLVWVDEADLPPEAWDTLDRIDDGGPYPYDQDDGTFGNFEQILPERPRGHYREYTVDTPGLSHRGARRIVTGNGGEFYWTADHYQSFERIRR